MIWRRRYRSNREEPAQPRTPGRQPGRRWLGSGRLRGRSRLAGAELKKGFGIDVLTW
jgi:hypothetical protein